MPSVFIKWYRNTRHIKIILQPISVFVLDIVSKGSKFPFFCFTLRYIEASNGDVFILSNTFSLSVPWYPGICSCISCRSHFALQSPSTPPSDTVVLCLHLMMSTFSMISNVSRNVFPRCYVRRMLVTILAHLHTAAIYAHR